MVTPPSDVVEPGALPFAGGHGCGKVFSESPFSLATEQVDAMIAAWRRGERPLAEEFMARLPGLGDEAAIRLIYEEACLRLEAGLTVDPAEIAGRFPKWRTELEALLDCQLKIHSSPVPVAFPEVGEELAGFHLLAELGRGASGRVFLASQPSLADRAVALKVTPRGRQEHLSLARLQHMNIVPLYSEHLLVDRNLQILCMPFLGGATLGQVLELLNDQPPEQRTGMQLIEALDRIQSRLPVRLAVQGPLRNYLSRASYVAAICSIGALLADGLQYAHDRNLIHMDIKPSNVLLAADGQPMLLDFHLARGPIAPDDSPLTSLGGTPEYMAPEQERALNALRAGRASTERIDGRADVYALGLLLYESLGGRRRGPAGVAEPLQECNSRVSPGLGDVISKCLGEDPMDRYSDAAALATDLRRHLADLPLLGVPNRSFSERWRKWRRRRPYALSRSLILLAATVVALFAGSLAWGGYRQRVHDIEAALAEARASQRRRNYSESALALRRGLALAGNWPGLGPQRRALQQSLAQASRNEKASELHRLAELLRFRYGIAQPPPEETDWLIRQIRAIWQARGVLVQATSDRRETDIQWNINTDMLDVVSFWADLLVRVAPAAEAEAARREALQVLTEAEASFGSSPSLERARRSYAQALGLASTDPAPAPAPQSAWEHHDVGRFYLRSGKLELADEQFQRGLELMPQDFWLNFHHGLCAYRLGHYEQAASAFHVCIALSPETAECDYNRGLANQALGKVKLALIDYGRALEKNGALLDAARNRGLLLFKERRYSEASADLEKAVRSTSDRTVQGEIHYTLALVDLARKDRSGAIDHLKAASSRGHEHARDLLEKLRHHP